MKSPIPGVSGGFDVAIVGGGVVGCAVARRFALDGARVVLIEKAADLLDGASKANSAILHTGFDAPPGSLELECLQAGYEEFMSLSRRGLFPRLESAALVVAWDESQASRLPDIAARAEANGVDDTRWLDAAAVRALEPALGAGVQGGVRVPREFLIDPWSTPLGYLLQAEALGALVLRSCALLGGQRDHDRWCLHTSRGVVRADTVVNCAGLYGDRVDACLLGSRSFEIHPRKGQFLVFDKSASELFGHTLLPVPSERTYCILVCRTLFGNVLVGPTAEEQDSRETACVDECTLHGLRAEGERIVPALAGHDITATYAGLRPASQFKDYQIKVHHEHALITVGAIRSTGLSAALGIARYVRRGHDQLKRHATHSVAEPLADPLPTCVADVRGLVESGHSDEPAAGWPVLAEHQPRDWQRAGNGGIVCHCERVTRREIEQALSGPLPVATLAGLKRRTRAMLGRCQGFYCLAEVQSIADRYWSAADCSPGGP